jgi:microcystin-dependent protein
MIMLWSGSIASIPSGWALCDGSSGTPNLRDRFVVGAGNTYAVNATGGSADAIVVSHTHSITDSGHAHDISVSESGSGALRGGFGSYIFGEKTTTSTTGITINSTGSSGTNANLPPYYALAYIMKL